jgi:hypothetical protein
MIFYIFSIVFSILADQAVGIDAAQMDSLARADHAAEIRLAEKLFYRSLAHLVQLASQNGKNREC